MTTLRRRVIYTGRVQGVGFRMTARRLSTGYPIQGYVRNQSDGGVELVAEGESHPVISFLQAIHREFGDMIQDVCEFEEIPAHEPLVGFTIRY